MYHKEFAGIHFRTFRARAPRGFCSSVVVAVEVAVAVAETDVELGEDYA